jgi:uncharacterized membrane protein YbhN (UPF0104 family)
LRQVSDAIYIYRFHPREVLLAVLASLAVHVCVVTMNLLLARAVIPGDLPWINFFFLIPLAQIAMAIPINPPGALGTAEGAYGYLLHLAGLEQGALVCLLQRFTYYLWALLGCYCYVKRKVKVAEAVEAVRHEDKEPGEGACAVAVAPAAAVEP